MKASIFGALGGAVLALVALQLGGDALVDALSGPQPKVWWYLSRSSGIVSFGLLATSMAFGLLLSTRFAKSWPGAPVALVLHRDASIVGIAFALVHALVLLGDRYTPFTLAELALPFGAAYRPAVLGLGQLAAYGAVLLVVSFYLRKTIGARAWRALHYASFGVFALGLAHGLIAGPDLGLLLALAAAPCAVVLTLVIFRVLDRLVASGTRIAAPRVQPRKG